MVSVILSIILLFLGILNPAARPSTKATGATLEAQSARNRLLKAYAELPLSFEANQGQTDRTVQFLARANGYTLFLRPGEALLELQEPGVRSQEPGGKPDGSRAKGDSQRTTEQGQRTTPGVLRMRLMGASSAARVSGVDQLAGKSNYFIGNDPSQWHVDVPTYRKVKYAGVYPGVDLVYYGAQGRLEYDFVVAPGADPRTIILDVGAPLVGALRGLGTLAPLVGARGRAQGPPLRLDAKGDLIVKSDGGDLCFRKPVVYQEGLRVSSRNPNPETRTPVDARYVLMASNQIRFEVGRYDRTKPLIIDPVLDYSTYLGGSQGDVAYAIALDSAGDAYVTGSVGSTNFPTVSPYQSSNGGGTDAFVSKLTSTCPSATSVSTTPTSCTPASTSLAYSTYLGGGANDQGNGIAVDGAGNAYVVGTTASANFPVSPACTSTAPAFQCVYAGTTTSTTGSTTNTSNAFVTKLNPTGNSLVYSSFLGGSGPDFGLAIAIDSAGNAYLTGSTSSTNFRTLAAFQGANDGAPDAFITKVNPTGTALVYSTYFGGSNADTAQGIAVDASGNAYITGYTFSTNFPLSAGAVQASNQGGADAFVSELNANGSALVFSTYLGGSGQDRSAAIALDSSGSIYITGDTASANFPVTPGVLQTSNRSASSAKDNAFVAKLGPSGTSLGYSTFLGGTAHDQGTAIAVDSAGDAYVTGFTTSSNFPISNPVQAAFGGGTTCGSSGTLTCSQAFVAELNPQATALVYSTYLGGNAGDSGYAIALDSLTNAYVAGETTSSNFPAISGAFQSAPGNTGGSGNAFVVKLDHAAAAGIAITPQKLNFGNQALTTQSGAQVVTLVNAGTAALQVTSVTTPSGSEFVVQNNSCVGTIAPSGGTCTFAVTFTPTALSTVTDEVSIADNVTGSPHLIALSGTGVPQSTSIGFSTSSVNFGNQTVNTTSVVQTVTVTNTGTTNIALSISAITASGDFAETNDCPASVPQGGTCSIFINFTPTTTGTRSGTITLTDNASTGTQTISLSGTGISGFSLTVQPNPTQVITIGTTTATFTIGVVGPSSLNGTVVTLSGCGTGATCTYNPTTITVGQTGTSVLTVSGLTATTTNPLNFAVSGSGTPSGTSSSQTATLNLAIFFADFTLTAVPPLNTIAAGQKTTYVVTVAATNGFNQAVLLSCNSASVPPASTCVFSPSAVSLSGTGSTTSTLTVTTTARSGVPRPPGLPRTAPPSTSPRLLPWILLALVLALAGLRVRAHLRPSTATGRALRPISPYSLAVWVVFVVLAVSSFTGCNDYISQLIFPLAGTGTPANNYTITIDGTLGGGGTTVSRTATVNLGVS